MAVVSLVALISPSLGRRLYVRRPLIAVEDRRCRREFRFPRRRLPRCPNEQAPMLLSGEMNGEIAQIASQRAIREKMVMMQTTKSPSGARWASPSMWRPILLPTFRGSVIPPRRRCRVVRGAHEGIAKRPLAGQPGGYRHTAEGGLDAFRFWHRDLIKRIPF